MNDDRSIVEIEAERHMAERQAERTRWRDEQQEKERQLAQRQAETRRRVERGMGAFWAVLAILGMLVVILCMWWRADIAVEQQAEQRRFRTGGAP